METDPRIVKALELWAEEQEDPDKPIIISSLRTYSARQMVDEVKKGSKKGETIYECFKEFYLKGKEDSL